MAGDGALPPKYSNAGGESVENDSTPAGLDDELEREKRQRLTMAECLDFAFHIHAYMAQQVQFADAKASGVLVADGAVLAYAVTMLWYSWPQVGKTAAGFPVLCFSVVSIVALAGAIGACLMGIWPRVWKPEDAAEHCQLLDFYRCSQPEYASMLERATRDEALRAILQSVARQSAVAARKHALMRIAVSLTVVGGLAALALLVFIRP